MAICLQPHRAYNTTVVHCSTRGAVGTGYLCSIHVNTAELGDMVE